MWLLAFSREREDYFRISHDAWKGEIFLRDSVIRKGIGDPLQGPQSLGGHMPLNIFKIIELVRKIVLWPTPSPIFESLMVPHPPPPNLKVAPWSLAFPPAVLNSEVGFVNKE